MRTALFTITGRRAGGGASERHFQSRSQRGATAGDHRRDAGRLRNQAQSGTGTPMAHFQTTHPGHTRATAQQPVAGHVPAARKAHRGHAPVAAAKQKPAARAPDAAASAKADLAAMAIYAWNGTFDRIKLRNGFITHFGKDPHFDIEAIPHLELLVGFMENDGRIKDIRWMAYMLATACLETTHPKSEPKAVLDKHGKPQRDKSGKPLVRSTTRWVITMSPVPEVGRGANRNYFLAVKVKALPDGQARVTEQDGDQFTVTAKGSQVAINKGASMGAKPGTKAAKAYADDDGTEQRYYGRGYVQLTWWSNYASAGANLDMGLDLLLNPERVLQPETAYKLMAYGMLTGKGFANGHTLARYFHGAHTDYVGARQMVNGHDKAAIIARMAGNFETILIQAKAQASADTPDTHAP
ncbi:hypothetical protein ACFPME_15805 [Rhodanobacter umsongensis]|uniref:Glycoside hydrolase family 19 catalytic domain-containing protein n=1 Tax=Rhodanobacter umsongensis TaxID=633153 RepID=A0ABW0JQN4_9GAMM